MFKFMKKKTVNNDSDSMTDAVIVTLMPESTTTYGNVNGFFRFRNHIYYRAGKFFIGRCIEDNMSFTDSIKSFYPEEFGNKVGPDISNIEVETLSFINVIK